MIVADLSFNNLITNCITDQLADGMYFELAHYIGSMCLRGFDADPKGNSDFLAALPFRQQLNNFPLTRCKPIANRLRKLQKQISPWSEYFPT